MQSERDEAKNLEEGMVVRLVDKDPLFFGDLRRIARIKRHPAYIETGEVFILFEGGYCEYEKCSGDVFFEIINRGWPRVAFFLIGEKQAKAYTIGDYYCHPGSKQPPQIIDDAFPGQDGNFYLRSGCLSLNNSWREKCYKNNTWLDFWRLAGPEDDRKLIKHFNLNKD